MEEPRIVPQKEWQAALDRLLVKEKRATRERDAYEDGPRRRS